MPVWCAESKDTHLMVNRTTITIVFTIDVLSIILHWLPLMHAGAIASVDTFLPRATLHARAVLNCTGGEHNLIDCVQEFQLISSCAPFGTATAVCLGMPYTIIK